MSEEIRVEGYRVIIEKREGAYIASVPDLPGCAVQVERKEDISKEITRMIGIYLSELARERPKPKRGLDEKTQMNKQRRLLGNKK